jgi:hypothetical protein
MYLLANLLERCEPRDMWVGSPDIICRCIRQYECAKRGSSKLCEYQFSDSNGLYIVGGRSSCAQSATQPLLSATVEVKSRRKGKDHVVVVISALRAWWVAVARPNKLRRSD